MFLLNVFGNPQPLSIYLSKADGEVLTILNNIIVEDSANLSLGLNQQYELSFDIKTDSDDIWLQYITEGMYLFVEKIGLFRVYDTPIQRDGVTDTKSITAQSVDSEFDSIILNFPVNTGLKNSMEYLVKYDDDETEVLINPYTGIPYDWIVLYNTFHIQLHILDNKITNGDFGDEYNDNGDLVVTDPNAIAELTEYFNTIPRLKSKIVFSDNEDGSQDSSLIEYVIVEKDPNDEETVISYLLTRSFRTRIEELISFYAKYRKQLSLLDIIFEKTGYNWQVGKIWGCDNLDFSLANKKHQFEINETAYSFLTQTLARDIKSVVNFDNIKRLVNITPVDEIGEDTGITIGYDNLVNQLNINTNEDMLTTRIYVSGENELSVARVNFGSDIVDDLSYKVNAKDSNGKRIYVSDDFAERYNIFVDYRENLRDRYIQLSKDFEDYNEQISEIKNRVPLDDLKTDYGTFSMEELKAALTTYKNLLATLSSLYKEDYGDIGLNQDGSIKESYIKTTEYWYDYEAYLYTIKEIEFAIKVFPYYKDHTQWSSGDSDLYKSEINAWETEWSLYGTIELDAKIKDYHNRMDSLAQKGVIRINETGYEIKKWSKLKPDGTSEYEWDELSSNEKREYLSPDEKREYSGIDGNYKYDEYMEYYNYANEAQQYLDSLNTQIKSLETLRDSANAERLQITKDVTVDNYFSDSDLKVIYRLYHDATYSNENILITSIDDVNDRFTHMKELLDDAKDQISIISRPQLTFSVDCDNLLAMPEFKSFWDKFVPGNYIYVQYKDNVYVKLRLIGYSFNPLLPSSSTLQIQFSNYIRSRSYYRDWDSLLGNNSSSGVSQYSSGGGGGGNDGTYGESDDIDITISNTMLAKLLNTELFGTRVTDVILDTVDVNAITARSATFGSLANGTTVVDGKCITTGWIVDKDYNGSNGSITNTAGSILNLESGLFNFAGGNLKWDGDKLLVSGDIYANSLTLGNNVNISYDNISNRPDVVIKDIPINGTPSSTQQGFLVSNSGLLTASNAIIWGTIHATDGDFAGTITAKSGHIGYKDATNPGWIIKTGAIYSGPDSLSSTTAGTYIGTDGILNYKDANAYVKISNGSIIANNGNIGDWSITTSGLHYDANGTQASYITNIAPTILQYEFVSNTNSYNSRFYLDMWNFNIVPQLYFINNQGTTHNEGIFSPNQIGFSMTTSSENYTSTYGATGCNIPQMTCTNADIYNNLSVTGTISEGGTALSNKYATIHSHPYLAVRPAFIEMQPSSNAENGGFIDFHYNNSSADYTARIIENSQGVIRITSDTDNNLTFKDALGYYRHPVSSIGDPNRLTCLRTNSESVGIYGMWGVAGTLGDEGRTIACPSSDIRLKKNIKDCVISALPVINSIRMRQFDWKDESRGHWNCGFVVDEMEKDIDPNFSIGGNEENGLITYKSVNTFYLQGYEVKAIQELSQQVTELQSEIQSLKQQLTDLKLNR